MELRILLLDDHLAANEEPLARALRPFLVDTVSVRSFLEEGATLKLNGLLDSPVEARLRCNQSLDPAGVLLELEDLRSSPFDLVLLDDDWDPLGSPAGLQFAGQELLLEPVFDKIHGVDDSLPVIALFTRHWGDHVERIDRFAERLLAPPFRGKNKVTGLQKQDAGALRLLIQRVVAHLEIVDSRRRVEVENESYRNLMRLLGKQEPSLLPDSSPHRAIKGRSLSMRALYGAMEKNASTDLSFHLCGEAGTGKTTVAEAIHSMSARRKAPFCRVNLNVPETLLDAELFGIAGGVANDVRERAGQIEAADGGTLFLDNVDLMPAAIQQKFLHFLERGRFQRIGERKERQADVRVISASNRRLAELVTSGEFREDLYFRLRIETEVPVPPLRHRREDIPELVEHFLQAQGATLRFSPGAMAALLDREWRRNNVRELEAFLERAMTYTEPGEEIDSARICELLGPAAPSPTPLESRSTPTESPAETYDPRGQIKKQLALIDSMVRAGKRSGEIGRVLTPSSPNGRQNLKTFFGNVGTGETLTELGEGAARSLYPHALGYLETRLKSVFKDSKALPDWLPPRP